MAKPTPAGLCNKQSCQLVKGWGVGKSNYTTSNCTLLSIASVWWLVATKNELLASLTQNEEPALGNGQTSRFVAAYPKQEANLR